MYYINNDLHSITRYDMSKFMEFDQDDFCILDSYFCTQLSRLQYVGTIAVTTQENRPDLLSYDIYGDTMYWWILMLYNNLTSPNELKAGLIVAYPSLNSIENLYFTLSTKQKTKDTEV